MSETNHTSGSEPRPRNYMAVIIALAVLLGGGWMAKTLFVESVAPKTILLMGLDEGLIRTDVLMVAHIEPKHNMVTLLSVPRDTLVEIPCAGLDPCLTPDKVAHAHVYGGKRGPQVTRKAVENLLGVKIDHYVRVSYDGFVKVVDRLGGVKIVIDKNMHYEDPYAHPPLKIHFKASPQPQHLNGEDALKYVRFRADGLGDLGRIDRTKKFFRALAASLRQSGMISKLPDLVTTVWPYIDTDLDTATAISLARLAPKLDPENLATEVIPGADKTLKDGRWVWLADEAKTRELVDRLIRNPQPAAPPAK